jgi:hypothetical protein
MNQDQEKYADLRKSNPSGSSALGLLEPPEPFPTQPQTNIQLLPATDQAPTQEIASDSCVGSLDQFPKISSRQGAASNALQGFDEWLGAQDAYKRRIRRG